MAGFARTELKSGEKKTITVTLPERSLLHFDVTRKRIWPRTSAWLAFVCQRMQGSKPIQPSQHRYRRSPCWSMSEKAPRRLRDFPGIQSRRHVHARGPVQSDDDRHQVRSSDGRNGQHAFQLLLYACYLLRGEVDGCLRHIWDIHLNFYIRSFVQLIETGSRPSTSRVPTSGLEDQVIGCAFFTQRQALPFGSENGLAPAPATATHVGQSTSNQPGECIPDLLVTHRLSPRDSLTKSRPNAKISAISSPKLSGNYGTKDQILR